VKGGDENANGFPFCPYFSVPPATRSPNRFSLPNHYHHSREPSFKRLVGNRAEYNSGGWGVLPSIEDMKYNSGGWGVGVLDCFWNVMTHAQKPDFVLRRNGRVHLNRQERSFSRLLAAEVCASAVVMLDTSCSRGGVKGTGYPLHSPVPLHFTSRASPCAITFQLDYTIYRRHEIDSRLTVAPV